MKTDSHAPGNNSFILIFTESCPKLQLIYQAAIIASTDLAFFNTAYRRLSKLIKLTHFTVPLFLCTYSYQTISLFITLLVQHIQILYI